MEWELEETYSGNVHAPNTNHPIIDSETTSPTKK